MRALFFSIDIASHLDWGGYLATAAALQRQGHEVLWASGQRVAGLVQKAGVPFQGLASTGWQHSMPPLPPDLEPEARAKARRQRALDVWLHPTHVLAASAALSRVAAQFRPDVLFIEPFAAAGTLVAETLSLPLVVVGRPALLPSELPGAATPVIERLCTRAGVSGQYWDKNRGMPRSSWLHLDFFCRSWYADLTNIGEETVFCGGLPQHPHRPSSPSSLPRILITLGSTFNRDELFFRRAAESALLVGAQSWVVTGRHISEIVESLRQAPPARMTLNEWIDYDEAFARVDAVVHHGGVATTHAALVYGVPQVVVPHAGDQMPQAARVTQAAIGYGIKPRDFTYENAPLILADVLYDAEFRENAARLAGEMQELGGIETAVAAILRVFA
ncbi:MAG: glycosyltransferase family 1 protein [Chloroflexi bacterium]|nr:glycosyltransferase family 1 protein [Chloroflexota bacterium]